MLNYPTLGIVLSQLSLSGIDCGTTVHSIGFGAGGGGAGGAPAPPLFGPGGQGGANHFELQPLVCIVFSGKVITLTQQCITKVIKVTTNSQQDP